MRGSNPRTEGSGVPKQKSSFGAPELVGDEGLEPPTFSV